MESLLKQDQVNFEVLDVKENLLQVILLPNQFIYTDLSYIVYSSANLAIRDVSLPWYKKFYSVHAGHRTRIRNRKGGVEYIGLSKTSEKVIAINPSIFPETFIIDKNYVLAYTSGIKIHLTPEPQALLKKLNWREIKGTGLVFLQGPSGLIEKRLGVDEEINIHKNNIVAYTTSIKMEESQIYKSLYEYFFNDWALMKVKGPGTVIIVSNSQAMIESSKSIKRTTRLDFLYLLGLTLLLILIEFY